MIIQKAEEGDSLEWQKSGRGPIWFLVVNGIEAKGPRIIIASVAGDFDISRLVYLVEYADSLGGRLRWDSDYFETLEEAKSFGSFIAHVSGYIT